MKVVGMMMAKHCRYPTWIGSRMVVRAIIAAEMGEAATATWEATTAMDNGRDGRTPCCFDTSTMTGMTEYAVWPVPHSRAMR